MAVFWLSTNPLAPLTSPSSHHLWISTWTLLEADSPPQPRGSIPLFSRREQWPHTWRLGLSSRSSECWSANSKETKRTTAKHRDAILKFPKWRPFLPLLCLSTKIKNRFGDKGSSQSFCAHLGSQLVIEVGGRPAGAAGCASLQISLTFPVLF